MREIWLSSEDTGAYGRDIGTSLPDLLEALVQVLPEGAQCGCLGWDGGRRRLGWREGGVGRCVCRSQR